MVYYFCILLLVGLALARFERPTGMKNKVANVGENVKFTCMSSIKHIHFSFYHEFTARVDIAYDGVLIPPNTTKYDLLSTRSGNTYKYTLTIRNVTYNDHGCYICEAYTKTFASLGDLAVLGPSSCYDALIERNWQWRPTPWSWNEYFETNGLNTTAIRNSQARKFECEVAYYGIHIPRVAIVATRNVTRPLYRQVPKIKSANATSYVRVSANTRVTCVVDFGGINYQTRTGPWASAINIPPAKHVECV